MAFFHMRTSVHGRRFGLSATGGVLALPTSATSTGQGYIAQMWGDGLFQTVSSAADLVTNTGITNVSSDSTSGTAFVMAGPPAKGVEKKILFATSATALTLNSDSTLVKFNSTLAYLVGGGSTVLNFIGVVAGLAGSLHMVGLSTTAWGIVSHSVASSS